MLGAIAGDIIGSVYEFNNTQDPEFPLFGNFSRFTDDTVLTLAVARHLATGENLIDLFHEAVEQYPDCAWGAGFFRWARGRIRLPYNSWGNGAAMRVSPVAWYTRTLSEALELARQVTQVTHNHPEGVKGAQATAMAIWIGLNGGGKDEIRNEVEAKFGYDLDTSLAERKTTHSFDESCQGTVPPAIRAVLEAESYEQAIRNAILLGGDSDTLAEIAGSIAEPLFGVPDSIAVEALNRLTPPMHETLARFLAAMEDR